MTRQQFEARYLQTLNPQQKQAVQTVNGPVLLLAVPGSGKTTVLVTRLGYLVYCCGIAPNQILTMTYTVAATGEMQQRFTKLFGPEYAANMEFCTINGLSNRIVQYYARHHGRREPFDVISSEDSTDIITKLYRDINHEFPTNSMINTTRSNISYIKNKMLTPEEIEQMEGVDNLPALYRAYCSELKQRALMDYDDQLSYALTILKNYPDVLEYFQNRYPYLCVDESQDTSKIQHAIIRLLASKHQNLFMVGDEDQSIYGFRAAFPEALLAFEREYANTKVLLMEENYRSTREIVTAANAFVSNNRYRHKKQVRPTRKSGAPIHIIHADSRMAQYHYLFNTVQKCSSETAILYRNNESALPLIDLFQRSGIPFNCKSFEDNFFTNRLVVDIIDIIHFAYHPNDEELFLRIFYKFGSPISKSAALYACDRSRKNGTTILQELVNCPELSSYGRQAAMDLHTYLTDLPNQTADTALFQIWHTLNYSVFAATNQLDGNKFDVLLILGRQEPSPMDFLHRLEELRILIQTPCDDPKIPLTLSTIHSSKGLEYDTVYLLDMFNTILPSVAREDVANQTQLLEYEEERRMFYVAMTRAKNDLFALRIADQASEFLEELCSALPKQAIDPKELFAPLQQNLCGKTYTHSDFGKGKIICHWEDDLLVQYGTGQIKLQRLSELLEQRDRRITYETPKIAPPISPSYCQKQTISPGTPITHKNFGSGIVLSVQGDIAEIRFSSQVGDKRISLSTSLKNGSLKL